MSLVVAPMMLPIHIPSLPSRFRNFSRQKPLQSSGQGSGMSPLQCLPVLHQHFNSICVVSPGKPFSFSLNPSDNRHRHISSANRAYTSSILLVSSSASSFVAWAVWPSCHRKSVVRRKSLVLISHLTMFAHGL